AAPCCGTMSLDSFREREYRTNVDRNIRRRAQGGFQIRWHFVVLRKPRLHAGAVAGGLLLQEFLSQRRDGRWNPGVVDGVSAAAVGDGALFRKVVKLHHLRASMGLARAESQRAEDTCDVRRIIL